MGKGKRGRSRERKTDNKERVLIDRNDLVQSFIDYYRHQLVPSSLSEGDFDEMIIKMKTSLPHVFRMSPLSLEYERNIEDLQAHLETLRQKGHSAQEYDFLDPRFGRIFRLSVDRPTMKKNPDLHPIRDFLHSHTEAGDCHRQEFVSMIPPYFLDVRPEHSVLDCCASPGSKTGQILEMMSIQDIYPSGLVIANDVDPARCRTLIHQLSRLNAPHALVTCHPAQFFPLKEVFDRVLCDVVCSGDGTLRKNPDAAGKWQYTSGPALHPLQRSILRAGLEKLRVGGRLVYSTCSMNPVEDEAVINSVLLELNNAVVIKDVSEMYPGLKRSHGITSWAVWDGEKMSIEPPQEDRKYYSKSMFCTPQVEGLERCMRFYPQQNDSGAFFVSVLEKVAEIESKETHGGSSTWKEPPFVRLSDLSEQIAQNIRQDYGLQDDFPMDRLFVRADSQFKNIYLLSEKAAQVVANTDKNVLKAISVGVRVFSYKSLNDENSVKCFPCMEGIDIIRKYATKRVYEVHPQDMIKMLEAGNIGAAIPDLSQTTQDNMKNVIVGGIIITAKGHSYSAMKMRERISVHIKKDLIPQEIAKLRVITV